MRYRITKVHSHWIGLIYHTQYRYKFWPFWFTGPAFATEREAEDWVNWDIRNEHRGYETVEHYEAP